MRASRQSVVSSNCNPARSCARSTRVVDLTNLPLWGVQPFRTSYVRPLRAVAYQSAGPRRAQPIGSIEGRHDCRMNCRTRSVWQSSGSPSGSQARQFPAVGSGILITDIDSEFAECRRLPKTAGQFPIQLPEPPPPFRVECPAVGAFAEQWVTWRLKPVFREGVRQILLVASSTINQDIGNRWPVTARRPALPARNFQAECQPACHKRLPLIVIALWGQQRPATFHEPRGARLSK